MGVCVVEGFDDGWVCVWWKGLMMDGCVCGGRV